MSLHCQTQQNEASTTRNNTVFIVVRPFLNWQDTSNPLTVHSLMLQKLSVLIRDLAKEKICYALLRRGETSTIMPQWQAVVMEKWLLVEDPLESDNLMTSVTASFVKDTMQEIVYGDMSETALRSLLRWRLELGENGSTLTYQKLKQFMKLFGRLLVKWTRMTFL